MRITETMRLERALMHMEREKRAEEASMEQLEGIRIQEIIILRNKKRMYMAEVDQMIGNVKAEIDRLKGREEKIS